MQGPNFTRLLHEKRMYREEQKRKTTNEPQHDKTNKIACAPSEDSDQRGHPPSLTSLRYPYDETFGP